MTDSAKAIRQALIPVNSRSAAGYTLAWWNQWDDFHRACSPAAITELLAQLDAARLDEKRIDWLDREIGCPLVLHDGRSINLSERGLRHVIDAAMAPEKPA